MLRVAVIGGGPSGSCTAETLAKSGIKTWLFERKLDNAKPCGGAIPLCMVSEFDLPESIIDRKVRNMRMISPSNREVDISLDNVYGKSDHEYIGMCRREVMDAFMRNRAADLGATLINGLVTNIDTGNNYQGPYTLTYSDFSEENNKVESLGSISFISLAIQLKLDLVEKYSGVSFSIFIPRRLLIFSL